MEIALIIRFIGAPLSTASRGPIHLRPCAVTLQMSRPSRHGARPQAATPFRQASRQSARSSRIRGARGHRRRCGGASTRSARCIGCLRLPDPTQDEDINLALRRIRRAKPARPKQAKGLTRPYLDRFLTGQPDTPWGLRNRAMLCVGYELLTRRSELVALRVHDLEEREDGTLRVLIRRAKNDPFGEGRLAFTSARTARLVTDWLAWRGPEIAPLFCPIYHGKPIDRALSPDTVKRLVKEGASRAGLDPREARDFSGHSMRVGAAQDLLRRGHDTAAIMRAGGWTSINVLSRYLAHAEHNVWE